MKIEGKKPYPPDDLLNFNRILEVNVTYENYNLKSRQKSGFRILSRKYSFGKTISGRVANSLIKASEI